jgi:hypothetical protein
MESRAAAAAAGLPRRPADQPPRANGLSVRPLSSQSLQSAYFGRLRRWGPCQIQQSRAGLPPRWLAWRGLFDSSSLSVGPAQRARQA